MSTQKARLWRAPGLCLGVQVSSEPASCASTTSASEAGGAAGEGEARCAKPKNWTTFGWCSDARSATSRSKRALSLIAASFLRTLTATGAPRHFAARQTESEEMPICAPSTSELG